MVQFGLRSTEQGAISTTKINVIFIVMTSSYFSPSVVI